jgi:hypothetical protein
MTHKDEVVWWITQRELARIHKEHPNYSGPQCTDPIINAYRFCNVHRENDRVTRWLANGWRKNHESENFVAALLLARMINWPPTLECVGFPEVWDTDQIIRDIHDCEAMGKAWTSAYVITTCGKAMDKALYVVQSVCAAARLPHYRPIPGDTLDSVWKRLRCIDGLGAGFLAAQVVADLKYTPLLRQAKDWHTFAVSGPGSRRGVNRYIDAPLNAKFPEQTWREYLGKVIAEVQPCLPTTIALLHTQDWQNVMCEYDKWSRVKNGEGKPRQRYPSKATYTF